MQIMHWQSANYASADLKLNVCNSDYTTNMLSKGTPIPLKRRVSTSLFFERVTRGQNQCGVSLFNYHLAGLCCFEVENELLLNASRQFCFQMARHGNGFSDDKR